eukprot:sb/3466667/
MRRGVVSFLQRSSHHISFRPSTTVKMVQPDSKKACLRIGTHSGTFHCDEALACFMLRQLPTYKDALLVRSRDPSVLSDCDIVVDVGGVYDPATHRYDHHQRFVYLLMASDISEDNREIIYRRLYEYFFEEVDAVDNGVNQTEEKPKYHVTTTLAGRVRALNPNWNYEKQDFDGQFAKAMNLVGQELTDRINGMARVWLPAKNLVKQAFEDRFNVHPSGKIIRLSGDGCPWKQHLYDLEEETGTEGSILYVLAKSADSWRVITVGVKGEGFTNRLPLPEKWCGVRDEALSELTGIPQCVFVHASGFIGGNRTMEGALQMASKSLEIQGKV